MTITTYIIAYLVISFTLSIFFGRFCVAGRGGHDWEE